MSKLASTLKSLLAGEFICPVAHPASYDMLIEEEHRAATEAWVGLLGLRLVRLSEEGAFFLAPEVADAEARSAVRDSLRNVRATLSPVVPVLEAIRQAQGQDAHLQPGLTLWESELAGARAAGDGAGAVGPTPGGEQQRPDVAHAGVPGQGALCRARGER
jgi:hypothetical protein